MLDRYGSEIWRVTSVLDAHLQKSGGEWLVGEKCTYADLAFVPWYWLCPAIMGEGFEKVSLTLLLMQSAEIVWLTIPFLLGMGGEVPDQLGVVPKVAGQTFCYEG